MKAYHISRSLGLKEGTVIELYNNLKIGMDVNDGVLSDLFPFGIQEDMLSINLIKDLFPNGVSKHGIKYLSDLYYYYNEKDDMAKIKSINGIISDGIMEYSFELVRRLKYPHIPSRFESLFALENLDDIKKWHELTGGNYKIFEIEVDMQVFKLDASFLLDSIYSGENRYSQVEGFFAEFNWRDSNNYWNSLNNEDMKKPELLIQLPVTIGKEIKL